MIKQFPLPCDFGVSMAPKVVHIRDSFDGKPLSTLATKVPQIKKTGDVTRNTMKTIERGALVTIIDGLVNKW